MEAHPGLILKERFLDPLGISVAALAKGLGVESHNIAELCGGRRPLTPELAARLSLYFDVPVWWWLELQLRFEAQQIDIDSLRSAVAPFPELGRALISPAGARWLDKLPASEPVTLGIDGTLLERLRAMVALSPQRPERVLHEETYDNGLRALVGRDR